MSITIHPVSINQDDNINKLNKKFTDITLENEKVISHALGDLDSRLKSLEETINNA
jgi:hypothetical protein